ncbi:hypothetical protein DOM22_10875 [Bdellovibrio sp. ZAP7]|nr:hypothetical protein DOM22_10875 [Bdellovibrio sp. ZAP7]
MKISKNHRIFVKQSFVIWAALWIPFVVVGLWMVREILGPGILLIGMLAVVTFCIALVYFLLSILADKLFGYRFKWWMVCVFLVILSITLLINLKN